jgi:broad specificity phosphatase PhoE
VIRALAFAAALALTLTVSAPAAVYVVRHAEKALDQGKDPNLTEAGRARAKALARVLRSVTLRAVFATEFKRTQQTAAPAAEAAKLTTIVVQNDQTAALAERLRKERDAGDVLVVAHSDTIPDLLTEFGVPGKVVISSTDYDNLFVVDLDSASARMHRLHYGD